jgi:hypothetical protein
MIRRLAFAGSLAMLLIALGSLTRPSAAIPNSPAQGAGQPPSQSNMQDMMKMHEKMMAEMKASEAKLDALIKEMNAATGDAKVNAVAAAVNELVRQHKTMYEHMGQMHQQMMGGRGMMMKK